LQADVVRLEWQANKNALLKGAEADAKGVRFKAQGVTAQRKRLGLSAASYGRLVGVTAHTIYKWEHGTARPRKQQLAALASLRSLGKREAYTRLKKLGANVTPKTS
jgi:DNA-binding transcriptional regulator YiaG